MQLEQLQRLLAALADLELRASRGAELFASLPPATTARLLAHLFDPGLARRPSTLLAREGAARALRLHVTPALKARLREEAIALGSIELLGLLSDARPAREFDVDREDWVDSDLRSMTLGRRKQLARLHDPDLLARLACDPDPAVIRNLLANPRITERHVVGLTSRRPARPAVLDEVLRSRRWSQNPNVRRAIALNPYSPPALAISALSLLTRTDLREVARALGLAEDVRAQARRLLSGKIPSVPGKGGS
jgi:hypothetical protein